ncbi:MAG: bifunctional farnesyl-diphosphate farnesyltransferase/squalene synthase [Alectoria sarmentosa]|nr:MAG: bifunctional farnesyl-diphosphate farnesyltransferase/squalene synthase [Alectoria sarmentosa]
MVKTADVLYYAVHVGELRNIIQWQTWHQAVHERRPEQEAPSLTICFEFLDKTSRSFSAVIQELHPELLVPITLFYLILRGLDTIEDDMTLSLDEKTPLLREFHKYTEKEGWNYNGSGPKEKDRELLVQFQNVTEEFRKVKPAYREIIKDITLKMGNGMADYCHKAEHDINAVNTIEDYDLYCHYVAGLVGNGLTRLFVESGLANPILLERPQLQESMGLFLQKTNIIRDIKEDVDDKRRFWPKEIWSKYVDKFEDLCKPDNREAALNCSSEMVLDSLNHADQCLFYLAGLKEQSVFNFAAIPQSMAIATLELVFRNPKIFEKNIKITKGEACRIMMQSTQNLKLVCEVFREFTRKIHKKNTPRDPNFLKISIACGKIEQFIETIYPSQDPKSIIQEPAAPVDPTSKEAKDKAAAVEAKSDLIYMLIAVFGTLFLISCVMLGIAYAFGARFDVAFSELTKGKLSKPTDAGAAQSIIHKYDHGEL